MTQGPGWSSRALGLSVVRRRPTLPHPPECSTIGAVGLSFRVRYGTGRFPHAVTAVTLLPVPPPPVRGCGGKTSYRVPPPGLVSWGVRWCFFFYCSLPASRSRPLWGMGCATPSGSPGVRGLVSVDGGGWWCGGWLGVVVPQPHSGRSILAHTLVGVWCFVV